MLRKIFHFEKESGMKHVIRIKILVAVLLAVVTFAPDAPAQAGDEVCGVPSIRSLIVGITRDGGDVTISNSSDTLMIDFDLSSTSYMLQDVHIHIEAPNTDPFPTGSSGNGIPGQFDHQYSFTEPQNTFSFAVSLEDLGAMPGDDINIAAHAVVTDLTGSETSWAEWDVAWATRWGGYIEYTIQDCPMDSILAFFDDSVDDGSLTGSGSGNSANGRLNALRNMLEMAGDLINMNDIESACGQLEAASRKCDGISPPPDFVTGPAAEDLYDMILELIAELGCE
jgi:hypothetical protein